MYGPIDDIIPREPHPDVKETMDKLGLLIDKVVDFGSNIFKWDAEIKRSEEYNSPILLSFRHFLELADSTSILVKQSSIEPSKLILRGMLETYFGLAYLLEKDTIDRGMAFLVWHIHKKIKELERADPTTQSGKQFRAILSKDQYTSSIKLPADPHISAKKAAFENVLKKAEYIKAAEQYQQLREKGENNPAWYRLFNGPRDVIGLAKYLKMEAIYEIIYREWSGPTHGTDIFDGKVSISREGTAEIHQLRYFGSAQKVTTWALNLSLMMFELYIAKRIPEKHNDYSNWYNTIRGPYLRICDREPIIVVT